MPGDGSFVPGSKLMKTAIYVEDGVTQIVLTPVTAFEREVLTRISRDEVVQVRVAKGSFRRDPEGWQRFGTVGLDGAAEEQEHCLMLRLGAEGEGPSLSSTDGAFNVEDLANAKVPLQVDHSVARGTFRPRDL